MCISIKQQIRLTQNLKCGYEHKKHIIQPWKFEIFQMILITVLTCLSLFIFLDTVICRHRATKWLM